MIVGLLFGCSKQPAPPPAAVAEVTAITVAPKDAPVTLEFVAQTQSSREVEIRARVQGFLDKRLYTEGQPVRTGQVLFQMDRKPFEAALQSAKGQLKQQQARLDVATQNLARVRPLAAQNAVSQKDLDDAIGNEQQARAAVLAAEGEVRTAQLNLSYTTISSPLTGLTSYARKQEGSYVTPGEGGFLTYVSQLNPMWVNFSMSENELLKYRTDLANGRIKAPPNNEFDVEVVLADGSVFPNRGRINFIDPSFSKETGTFLIRTVVDNPEGKLRPGQFVRAKVISRAAGRDSGAATCSAARRQESLCMGDRQEWQSAGTRSRGRRLAWRRLVYQPGLGCGRAPGCRRRDPGIAEYRAQSRR